MLELRHVRSFVAIAEEGNIVRAARRLFITQPALSRQLQQLERDVGTPLLERAGAPGQLTAAGRVFLDHARRLLDAAEAAQTAATRAAAGVVGRLVVGFVSPAAYVLLPDVFRAFRERMPEVAIELRQLPSADQLRAIRAREIDVGFMYPPDEPDPEIGVRVVAEPPFVAALPVRHPLASRRTVAPGALAREAFVTLARRNAPRYYDAVLRICQEAGFSPRVVQEAEQMQTILALVAADFGVSIVPEWAARSWQGGVAFLGLEETAVTATLAVAWRSEVRNPAVPVFVALLGATPARGGGDA